MKTTVRAGLAALLLIGCQSIDTTRLASNSVWTEASSPVNASLRGIDAVDELTCWATGSQGTWLRTIDGGETWTSGKIEGAAERDFRDVVAFDSTSAIALAVGSPAEFWMTDDGGGTWRRTWSLAHPDAFLDAMEFWDGKRGIAWGDPIDGSFCILLTEDGGETWNRVPEANIPPPAEGEAGFAASGSCLSVGPDGRAWIATGGARARVLRSEDHGRTWTSHETDMNAGENSTGGFSLVVLDDGRGVLVGGDYANPEVLEGSACFTEDDGRTWLPASAPQPGYRSQVAWGGPRLGWLALGKTGASLSADGESWVDWSQVEGGTPAPQDLYAFSFSPTTDGLTGKRGAVLGWAVGREGKIGVLRTPSD